MLRQPLVTQLPQGCIDEKCAPILAGIETIFGRTILVALGFAGIALFIVLLVGGFKYITSSGDPKNVEAARRTLTYAILGFVLVASAYLILRFIGEFTGAEIGNFTITQ
ncbi:MAG: hypothetical protein BMS9Abin21_138 [Thermodesulfovibrionia bacterium]|nr:MAG: hypothetical protein BMS9Abin21_138 [Thermodesulfovibrionia bacterium]